MKNKYLIINLLFSLLLPGCNKWLDIEPSNKVDDTKLFSTYEGFHNSLNGIYHSIASGKLYGREMTWGTASVIGQDYISGSTGTSSTYQYMQLYDYSRSTTKAIVQDIWSTAYNAIANCNKLIQEVEKKRGDFFPEGIEEKNLILGEALALRGMLHFDILRLFAPAPSTQNNDPYIPYFAEFPSYYSPKLSTTEVLDKVIADLERAKDLVMQWDTTGDHHTYLSNLARRFKTSYLYIPKIGEFFGSRVKRLNFVAINGLLARVNLYAGKTEKAKEYSAYIYDTFGPAGKHEWGSSPWFKFTPTTNIGATAAASNFIKLYDDILFGVYDNQLLANIENFKLSPKAYMRLNMNVFNYANWDDNDDARKKLIVLDAENKEISQKWVNTGALTTANVKCQYTILPIIRLSEIYYILSECLYLEGNITEAQKVLNEVRNARGAKRKVDALTAALFKEELIWEYRKEFMTEGQTFYIYKRLNEPAIKIGYQNIAMKDNYIFPLPSNEEIF